MIKAEKKWAVIPWKQSGMYRKPEVVKYYESQKLAQKYCDKNLLDGLVVREAKYLMN